MATLATTHSARRDWRAGIFRAVAGLVTLVLLGLGGLHGLIAPWLGHIWVAPESPAITAPLTHLWHDGQFGAFVLAAVGSLALAMARPRGEPLRVQLYAAVVAIFLLAIAPFNPVGALIFAVIFGLPILAHPEPRALFGLPPGRLSRPMLAVAALTAALLAPSAWGWLRAQLAMAEEHALHYHWAMGLAASLIVVTAQLMAATRRPGWRGAASVAALVLAYLGAAAIAQAGNPGSWGLRGGATAIVGAALWVGLALREGRAR